MFLQYHNSDVLTFFSGLIKQNKIARSSCFAFFSIRYSFWIFPLSVISLLIGRKPNCLTCWSADLHLGNRFYSFSFFFCQYTFHAADVVSKRFAAQKNTSVYMLTIFSSFTGYGIFIDSIKLLSAFIIAKKGENKNKVEMPRVKNCSYIGSRIHASLIVPQLYVCF